MKEGYTPIPNIIFDQQLKNIGSSELKILLVIIRQTYGWVDKKTGKRKEKDRISYTQFARKTGLSRKTISKGISLLSKKNLIKITDSSGYILNTTSNRQGQTEIWYQHVQNVPITCVNFTHNKRNYTKEINNKEIDYKHIKEILIKTRRELGL
ncbi:MAG: hypothetical protein A2W90_04880 [Bacteroidetes bacterium GWF2_42_66]|nr:MAG: hypothetical protein A2W89_21100 [Bacteroidetes bacterium GWE2_42_39]OFY40821.1 MAG: hypothetical protein A2W90_04880 [Bacteroidetes bacterium GWF2_42_66]HAZ00589.1 hypothetical protein [Marinilabiliales bacterium]HBL75840.1 hypothetical protein [Prolixibacteraceae bacterium]HCU63089.1 hypothetical protein [Prolixibacteraceae bacterium]